MMCGLPGSGKSWTAHHLSIRDIDGNIISPIIHSSDDLRQELYGDADDQSHNDKLFQILHKRIRSDLSHGNSVVYDATNINKKRRTHFLKSLDSIECNRVCVLMATQFALCCNQNNWRVRMVPHEVMWKMYKSFTPPAFHEGFDEIFIVYTCFDRNGVVCHEPQKSEYSIFDYLDTAFTFHQNNEHHSKTLGDHCASVARMINEKLPNNNLMMIAALLHDNGKLKTCTWTNARGANDGNCHYYGHENVGAYDSLFYLKHDYPSMPDDDVLYVSNLIAYHMRPYTSWKSSEKAYKKDMEMCGRAFIEDIELLHEADVAAH